MSITFFKAHWIALLLSAGAIAAQFALPQANWTPVLFGLIVLVWGLTSAFALCRSASAMETGTVSDAIAHGPGEVGEAIPQSEPYNDQIQQEQALVRSLFDDLNQTVRNEVATIRNELYRIREHVGDAAAQLSDSFQGLTEWSQTQQNLIMSVIENVEPEATSSGDEVSKSLAHVSNLANQISEDISQAIRVLQFEDIVSQQLDNPLQHLDMLERFVTVLKNSWDELNAIEAVVETDCAARLRHIRDNLSQSMQHWEEKDDTLVRQDSMQAGSIDLF